MEKTLQFRLSPQQERLWRLLDQDGAGAYEARCLVRIEGALDVARLAAALRSVVERHQILRTVFRQTDAGVPLQAVEPAAVGTLARCDLSTLPPARQETELTVLFDNVGPHRAGLREGPSLTAVLVTLSASRHRLLLALPALCIDRSGLANLVSEIGRAYERREAPAEEPTQYADLAEWQRDLLESPETAEGREYWQEANVSALEPTSVPGADEPPVDGRFRPRHLEVAVPPRLETRVARCLERDGASPEAFFLACWQILLWRLEPAPELVVGMAFDGRKFDELKPALGPLTRVLPVAAGLRNEEKFSAVLQRASETIDELREWQEFYAWQDAPFFPLVYEYVERPGEVAAGNVTFLICREQVSVDRCRLKLACIAGDGPLALEIQYDADRLTRGAAGRMAQRFLTLIQSVVERSEASVADLQILSPSERHQQLVELNDSTIRLDAGDLPLAELIARQVARTPDRIALVCEASALSYRELDRRADRLARHLRSLGVGPDVVAGLAVARSLDLVVGMLAILKAGGAYLPLDPAYPDERLAFMLRDAAVSVVLTRRDSIERLAPLAGGGTELVCLDEPASTGQARDGVLRPSNLAYVIYTSGSTGVPKGVQVPHRAVVNFFAGMDERLGEDVGTWLAVSSISFDISVLELLWTLRRGFRVVLAAEFVAAAREGAETLPEQIVRHRVTHLQCTPSMAHLVALDRAAIGGLRPLRKLMLGGEALPSSLARLAIEAGVGELYNLYGPTETTIWSTTHRVERSEDPILLGRPIANTETYLLDRAGRPVPIGVAGELWIGGSGVVRGYLQRSRLTAERFVPDPFSRRPGRRLYRTGDLARVTPDGRLDFLGRIDHQIKLRGFRIELGEIEAALEQHPEVSAAAVVVRGDEDSGDGPSAARLVAYYVSSADPVDPGALRRFLAERLPSPMLPSLLVGLDALPLMPNGKVDRAALGRLVPGRQKVRSAESYRDPSDEVERKIAAIWQEVLEIDRVGTGDNFFDIGGHSLLLAQVRERLHRAFDTTITVQELLRHPTVAALARFLRPRAEGEPQTARPARRIRAAETGSEIAIVGMSCRFPGAADVEAFWRNLRDGVESIRMLDEDGAATSRVDAAVSGNGAYVRASAALDDPDLFAAGFFKISPREAEILDPQHRIFLECAWEALEISGYDSASYPGRIGVYAGAGMSRYAHQLFANGGRTRSQDFLALMYAVGTDHLATRVAYKLNLTGPSVGVQTTCSTSLVAVHMARQALLQGECDMALAGGVSLSSFEPVGYRYVEGSILSPDGHCRAFDARARGTVFGSGAGLVVLKRLTDALRDGDNVRAVIKGSAINNDGAFKVGYTAPSEDAQAEVIREAQLAAGVEPATVSYVEAHGTATPLGDPIEVAALTRAFDNGTDRRGFCALGSVKTNIGHTDTAAGVAGLIKTTLALEHAQIPPSLHFESPNPAIDFARSPFYVNAELRPWKRDDVPRRAGVSSFGIGGANAHVVLEEAPQKAPSGPSRDWQLFVLSARSATALETAAKRLARHLRANPAQELADVAYTLKVGRRAFEHRRALVARDRSELVAALEGRPAAVDRDWTAECEAESQPVAFLFPGQGSQHVGMGRELYEQEAVFRQTVEECSALLEPRLELDLRRLLYPAAGQEARASRQLQQTVFTQPALFVMDYALARLWMALGVRPAGMFGHSVGEIVAACLAGVFSLDDALALVATRGRLMQSLPPGAMTGVALAPKELEPWLGDRISLAAINGPKRCVVSGDVEAVATLERQLSAQGVAIRRLPVSHAFHSPAVEPILETFRHAVGQLRLSEPELPFLSGVTGTWISPAEATDPDYWVRHLRQPVRFARALEALSDSRWTLLEVGPPARLTTLSRRHPAISAGQTVLASMRPSSAPSSGGGESQRAWLLSVLGRLWAAGCDVDWRLFYRDERRHRVVLPTYPFERQRFWFEPRARGAAPALAPAAVDRDRQRIDDWFYVPTWRAEALSETPATETRGRRWLAFVDDSSLGSRLVEDLRRAGHEVVEVRAGESFSELRDGVATIDPRREEEYASLLEALERGDLKPRAILHAWSLSGSAGAPSFDDAQHLGLYSLLALNRALVRRGWAGDREIVVVSSGLYDVDGSGELIPENATLLGAIKVLPQEFRNLTCRAIDVASPAGGSPEEDRLAGDLVRELTSAAEPAVAYRGGDRYVEDFEPVSLETTAERPLRHRGVYLLTGGFGRLGQILARHLAETLQARLILTSRSPCPGSEAPGEERDGVETKRRQIRELEALGAEVLAIQADVADRDAMTRAVRRAREDFGALNGVFHLAGSAPRDVVAVEEAGPEACGSRLRAKVEGLRVLDAVLGDAELDFRVVFSSLASILGGLGFVAYAAANAFADAFAHRSHRAAGRRWRSVNWDAWREENAATPSASGLGSTITGSSIAPADGVRALRLILSDRTRPRIVVSTTDLKTRVARWIRFEHEEDRRRPAEDRAPEPLLHPRPELRSSYVAPTTAKERAIAGVWQQVLGIEQVGIEDNFFDLGGDSLLLVKVRNDLRRMLGQETSMLELLRHPTVATLAAFLGDDDPTPQPAPVILASSVEPAGSDVAIIGMSGRFPGAKNPDEFWYNLKNGIESIGFFTDEELLAEGYHPEILRAPRFVKALPIIEDSDWFDGKHFGITPREAETIDPQHRIFLETTWEALENAGYDPQTYPGAIGMFAGAGVSRHWLNLASHPRLFHSVGVLQLVIGSDKDYLPTRVSFKLNLKGPSLNVQSACSTSLIAVHLACQSLLRGECQMALAGGVALTGNKGGYFYEEGGILSPDGHCRAFDAKARGTVFGSGSGVVVLKPLANALADGDSVHAVIKGSAINNDGSLKVGYTAPGFDGQVRVLRDALASAGVSSDTISYVEAHGTATQLGDPIEVGALREVFGSQPGRRCALGSVKTNIGHADAAAGVAGLLKTVLALKNRQIPPSLHFEEPNAEIDFENSPFYVNDVLSEWKTNGIPRRAGVSAFGVGGSNAHVVVEEAPEIEPSSSSRPWLLLVLSARTPTALETMTANLANHLENRPEVSLADVAYTLQVGRRAFAHRRFLVCDDVPSAVAGLRSAEGAGGPSLVDAQHDGKARTVAFLFPGQGAQYVGMGRGLYESEDVFRRELDRCAELLRPHLGRDLRSILFPPVEKDAEAADDLRQTRFTQPALFALEYALARQWISWGVRPGGMVGHSIGEYVAACLAGVFSLDDALRMVAVRGRLMQSAEAGAMLSVPLAAEELEPLLQEASDAGEVSLAALNAPKRTVAGGTFEAVAKLEAILSERGVEARRLHTSHAFHSPMMEPILDAFRAELERLELGAPQIPFVSNLTGRWITDAEAQSPEYWVQHLRQPVQFSRAVEELLKDGEQAMLEVGPGRSLASLARQNPAARGRPAVASLRGPREETPNAISLLSALGRLWQAGCEVDWQALYDGERRHRIPLPTYPFERQRYAIEEGELLTLQKHPKNVKNLDISEWFYIPTWKPSDVTAPGELGDPEATCLLFADETGLGDVLSPELEERFGSLVTVRRGEAFSNPQDGAYVIDPSRREDYEALLRDLNERGQMPATILFLWGVTADPGDDETPAERERYLEDGIYALFHLAQLLEEIGAGEPMHLVVVSTGVFAIDGSEKLIPEKATLVGPATVIPQEYRNIRCHHVDLVPADDWRQEEDLLEQLFEEVANDRPELAIAYRQGRRLVQTYEPVRVDAKRRPRQHFRQRGCYLITGGLGGLGLTFARHLAETAQARLVLTGRSSLPPRETWSEWLAEHDDDDSTSSKIRKVQELEALGAEVMLAAANVADRERMAAVVAEARERFGPIRGVLQAAGLPSGGLVQNKRLETIVETLEPKVQGTRVLESVLDDEELDFFVLFSSSGAILGGLGYYDYGAANAFLDAFAHARTAAGKFTQAVNWGPWQEAGMAVVSNMGFTSEEEHKAFLRQGIASAEGLEIFHRILDRRFPQVAVWTMDFPRLIRAARLLKTSKEDDKESRASDPRPELATGYVKPRDEVESDLAEIWEDLLGIDQVGVQDDFFELGADSLLATQMLSRVRRRLGVSIPHHKLFETPNIAALAALVQRKKPAEEIDEIEALLSEVEQMSESELDEVVSP